MHDHEEQIGFELGEMAPNAVYSPNLAEIREDLDSILELAKSAIDHAPWDARMMRYNKIIFLQMTKWLPDDEAEQYCFTFLAEYERIEGLLAA